LCDIYADILQLRDTIAIEGKTYTTKTQLGDFLIKANPAVAMLDKKDGLFKSYLVEFGLTPAARSKVKIDGGEEEEDPLNQYFG
ncbi:P27 family phage terminase small subunit, partial [Proteus mirabilis]